MGEGPVPWRNVESHAIFLSLNSAPLIGGFSAGSTMAIICKKNTVLSFILSQSLNADPRGWLAWFILNNATRPVYCITF